MAAYAIGRGCVRAAAGGFSPDAAHGMPRQKRWPRPAFQFMLETRRALHGQNRAPDKQEVPLEKTGGRPRAEAAENPGGGWLNKMKNAGEKSSVMQKTGHTAAASRSFPLRFLPGWCILLRISRAHRRARRDNRRSPTESAAQGERYR